MKKAIALLTLSAGLLSACGASAPMVVTADELMDAWAGEGQATYQGQTVQVTGTVAKAEMVPLTGFKVYLGEPDGYTNFQCLMTAEATTAAEALAEGDEVTLIGEMTTEDTLAASASNCEFAE